MKKFLLGSLLLLGFSSYAQVAMTGTGSYSQDFNTLPITGTTNTWTDNTTLPNWYAKRASGAVLVIAGDGSANTGGVYSFGTSTTTERALGSCGSTGTGTLALGVQFHNTTAGIIEAITVTYTMEQWRNGGNTSVQPITWYYKVSTSSITDLAPGNNSTWTAVPALDASSLINTSTAAALNGNLTDNQVVKTNIVIPGLSLQPGEYMMLKWDDINDSGNDHGLSVDDFSISWTASAAPCVNTTATIDTVSCAASYTTPSGLYTHTTDGTYNDTITNANGCDSILTINLTFVTSFNFYPDLDGDGFGDNSAPAVVACVAPADHVTNNTDCDDTDPAIGAGTAYYPDLDGDGLGDHTATAVIACSAPTDHVANNTDCDDSDDAIGIAQTYYQDLDGDGFGNPAVSQTTCTAPTNYVLDNTDCNDNNLAIHPGATEIPDNGIDEDCNGSDLSTLGTQLAIYEFIDNTCPLVATAMQATTTVTDITFEPYAPVGSLDCNSATGVINYSNFNTGSTVNLNQYYSFGITPDDCIGMDLSRIIFTHKISGSGGTPTIHLRSSLDNFATDIATKQLLNSTAKTDTINLGAAFDNVISAIEFRWYITNMAASGATYRHDNVKIFGSTHTLTAQTFYADTDGDGFGDPAVTQSACTAPAGYVSDNTDCNDNDPAEHPGAVWYADLDGDGFGDATDSQVSCTQPTDYVSNNTDCNDADDQLTEEVLYYVDLDEDGFGDANDLGTLSCSVITGSVTNNDDCDDDDDTVYPNAPEICDGKDNNCDGTVDEGLTTTTYYKDADGDTYGDPTETVTDCTQPVGYVTDNTDCDDANVAAYPGATEIPGNGIDENCDGVDGYLGIDELAFTSLSVFPNPGNTIIVLSASENMSNTQVSFIGVDGKEMILSGVQTAATELTFNTANLVSGTYFIRVTSDKGSSLVRWVKN